MISLGSVLRDSYLAVPTLSLPPKSMLHLTSASQLCILIDQCCIRRKRGIGDVPPSLLFALLSLGPFVRFLFGLLQNGASSSWIM